MSLVRISNNLIGDVEERITEVCNKVFATTVLPSYPLANKANVDAVMEIIERKVWGPHMHLKDQMPSGWLITVARVDFTIAGAGLPEYQLQHDMVCPPGSAAYAYIDVKLNPSDFLPDMFAALLEYKKQCDEHSKKFSTIRVQVKDFLHSCKSLNDALKKYPDIALYIPKSYIDRVNTKDARAAKADEGVPVTPNIDRDLVTSMGVVGALHDKG